MERLKRAVFGVLIALALCGCTCGLAGCTSREADAEQPSRFDVERVATNGMAFTLEYMSVLTLTDTETGQQWVVVSTENGVAMAPMEGGE